MKTFTNISMVENRAKWAKRVAPVTMIFLFGGLIINFISFNRPEYFQYAVISLGIGFVLSMVSSNLVNNWVREPRADQTLSATLKKFGNDFILFNYTSAAAHVLLTPTRLYVVIVRRQAGEITVNGERFSRKFSFIRLLRFFAEEGLGIPGGEVRNKRKKLYDLLKAELDDDAIPEISGLVVFTSKDVVLNLNAPTLPVLTTSELKLYLRENDKSKLISAKARNQIIEILGQDYEQIKK